ncbi:MAG: hypothetical protein ACXAD7_12505 [Candidatus Kariarchaeaceae archaeon]|jgi:hypothetical protein
MFNPLYRISILRGACFLIIALTLITSPFPVKSLSEWSDDFEDGNLDDWDVWGINWTNNPILPSNAKMIVEDGVLKPVNTKSYFWAYACHESTNAFGTWSFDWLPSTNQNSEFVSFIGDDTNWINVTEFYSNSYFLWLNTGASSTIPGIDLHKHVGTNLNIKIKSHYGENYAGEWHHVVITRESDGIFKIYLDDELVIEEVDTDVTVSEEFCFSTAGDAQYDNIQVSEEVKDPTNEESSFASPIIILFTILAIPIISKMRK